MSRPALSLTNPGGRLADGRTYRCAAGTAPCSHPRFSMDDYVMIKELEAT
ncbi:MAG: hypothetical protein PHR30_17965 [Gallionellaceae bacterium]|nr:hypothetical protein [Gallionellaceae bacterium]